MSNILLTPEEVKELNRLCRDPFMELGMTLRPEHLQCFERKIATHSVKVIILFEKHENAEKWNGPISSRMIPEKTGNGTNTDSVTAG